VERNNALLYLIGNSALRGANHAACRTAGVFPFPHRDIDSLQRTARDAAYHAMIIAVVVAAINAMENLFRLRCVVNLATAVRAQTEIIDARREAFIF
jgi:hypothetical protein